MVCARADATTKPAVHGMHRYQHRKTPPEENSVKKQLHEDKISCRIREKMLLILDFDQNHPQETYERTAELETSHIIRLIYLIYSLTEGTTASPVAPVPNYLRPQHKHNHFA